MVSNHENLKNVILWLAWITSQFDFFCLHVTWRMMIFFRIQSCELCLHVCKRGKLKNVHDALCSSCLYYRCNTFIKSLFGHDHVQNIADSLNTIFSILNYLSGFCWCFSTGDIEWDIFSRWSCCLTIRRLGLGMDLVMWLG